MIEHVICGSKPTTTQLHMTKLYVWSVTATLIIMAYQINESLDSMFECAIQLLGQKKKINDRLASTLMLKRIRPNDIFYFEVFSFSSNLLYIFLINTHITLFII